jgi:monoamine oxidase
MSNPSKESDILIIGAGMSGLFAAWRLLSNDPSLSVQIVEKLHRTGGRLETTFVDINDVNGNKVTVHDEEGGMRFVPQESCQMQHLWQLIKDMQQAGHQLTPVDFIMGDENNRYYVRGRSFSQKNVTDSNQKIWSELFALAPSEHGKNPSDILQEVVDEIIRQNKYRITEVPKSPSEWIYFRNNCTFEDYEGKPVIINKWGFWSMLRKYGLTQECIEMLSHVLGFMGPFQEYINAGEGLQILFDFPKPDKTPFKTLLEGFESLPSALEAEIKKMNGQIDLKVTIESLNAGANGYEVIGKELSSGDQISYIAKKVILAIPKKPLKILAENSSVLSGNTQFTKAVNSVKNMELTKVGLYFKERWWHSNGKINLTNGPNFTDLPMGSVYTFSQYPSDNEKDQAYNGPAALTQYTDYIRGNFWMELQNIGEMYQTDEFPQNPPGTYPASKSLVFEMMNQLRLLFGLNENDIIPMPVLSTYRVWGEGEFGYGYHQYKINVNDETDVYQNIYKPSDNLFVCNESWSPEQGWVEGALIMSDYVMVKGFGLKPYASDGITDI